MSREIGRLHHLGRSTRSSIASSTPHQRISSSHGANQMPFLPTSRTGRMSPTTALQGVATGVGLPIYRDDRVANLRHVLRLDDLPVKVARYDVAGSSVRAMSTSSLSPKPVLWITTGQGMWSLTIMSAGMCRHW